MLQCIFILSDSGEVMLEKQLTGHRVDRSICSWFWDQSISEVIASPTHYVFQILRDGITFLACSQVEMPPLMAIEFLCRVADVLSDYLGGLNEDLIKDNFIIVYELLDEMIDNGFPLTTEASILRTMIDPLNIVSKMLSVVTGHASNVSDTLPTGTGSCVPWRPTDPKYSSNEVYVDLVEDMCGVWWSTLTQLTEARLSGSSAGPKGLWSSLDVSGLSELFGPQRRIEKPKRRKSYLVRVAEDK